MATMTEAEVSRAIKEYILEEFLPGENPQELTEDTPLVTSGVLDSVATLKVSMFLQKKFGIKLAAHETDVEFMNTVGSMTKLVCDKLK
jgi:acyl carrier protein